VALCRGATRWVAFPILFHEGKNDASRQTIGDRR
jgi:hypothetical protein